LTTLNTGIVLLNDRPLGRDEPAAFCVLGMPRGGTTMTALLLQQAGVFIGANLPVTAEDPLFAGILRERKPDARKFRAAVERRSAEHARWGFKAPFRNHWPLLASIDNVRFVCVFRDVLAVANRNRISVDADLLANMRANLALELEIVSFIAGNRSPMMLISYEKALLDPAGLAKAVADFCGVDVNDDVLGRIAAVIEPNEKSYVVSQDPVTAQMSINVDHLSRGRIAGWARRNDGGQATIVVEIDGSHVATQPAALPRKDLATIFGGEGKFAFDVRLAPGRELASGCEVVMKNAENGAVVYRRKFP
jgi:hypothetical protein